MQEIIRLALFYLSGIWRYRWYVLIIAALISPVGWAYDELDTVLREAARSAAVTHDHPEGIKGAQAVAATVLLARQGADKATLRRVLTEQFGYDLSADYPAVWKRGGFDVSCQGTVPAAAIAFLEATDFEDAIRNAVSFGGDADTLACIAGAMAEAFYGGVPRPIQMQVLARLDDAMHGEVVAFATHYGVPLLPPQ